MQAILEDGDAKKRDVLLEAAEKYKKYGKYEEVSDREITEK